SANRAAKPGSSTSHSGWNWQPTPKPRSASIASTRPSGERATTRQPAGTRTTACRWKLFTAGALPTSRARREPSSTASACVRTVGASSREGPGRPAPATSRLRPPPRASPAAGLPGEAVPRGRAAHAPRQARAVLDGERVRAHGRRVLLVVLGAPVAADVADQLAAERLRDRLVTAADPHQRHVAFPSRP